MAALVSAGRGGFSASATQSVSGTGATVPVTTTTAFVTVSGGIGPFTYLWTYTGDPGIEILSPYTVGTAFRASPVLGEPKYGWARCEVTDTATGLTAITNECEVTITRA